MGFVCERCGECCNRYWIILLPNEAKEIAKYLKINFKNFVKKYCILYVDIFPASESTKMRLNSTFLPKKIYKKIKSVLTKVPDFLIILPFLVLKRKGKTCIFFNSRKRKCKIYKYRPIPCTLFPFITVEDVSIKKWSDLYPFCKGLKKDIHHRGNLFSFYYPVFEDYFNTIRKKGLLRLWKVLPNKGIVCFEGKKIGEISRSQFNKLVNFSIK